MAYALSRNHSDGLRGLWLWWTNLQSELVGSFDEESNLLVPVAGFIICGAFIDVLLAFGQQPIKQAG